VSEKEKYERACGGSAVLSWHSGITSLLLYYATTFLLAELCGSHELVAFRLSLSAWYPSSSLYRHALVLHLRLMKNAG